MTTLGLALAYLQNADDDFASERAWVPDRASVLRRAGREDMIRDPATRGEAQAYVLAASGMGDRAAPRPIAQPG